MALGDGVRRNIRTVSPEESQRFTRALLALQGRSFAGNERRGIDFLPWHRELCNRFEELLRRIDPDLSLHYWDWNEDPTDLFTPTFSLAAEFGMAFGPSGSSPVDESESVPSDDVILQAPSFDRLSALLERKHAQARFAYFGEKIVNAHVSLYDPFGILLHSNLDRLFAMWQAQSGEAWRLDPSRVYGDAAGALSNLVFEPWSAELWAIPDAASNTEPPKSYVHPSVVAPPCYETLPASIEVDEIATPEQVIQFRDVYAGRTFARAASFRVVGRGNLAFTVSSGPTGPYTVLTPDARITAAHSASLKQEVRIWFGYTGETPNTSAPEGTVTIRCDELQAAFVFRLQANTIAPPVVTNVGDLSEPDAAGARLRPCPPPSSVTWTWTWRSLVTPPRDAST